MNLMNLNNTKYFLTSVGRGGDLRCEPLAINSSIVYLIVIYNVELVLLLVLEAAPSLVAILRMPLSTHMEKIISLR